MYPCLKININGINENIKEVKKLCDSNSIKLNVVVKVLSGHEEVVNKLNLDNIDAISDARIANLKKYQNIDVEKWLIRLPSFDEIEDVVRYSDVSLNSSLETICLLNEEAKKQNKIHKVILMYELGDLREGVTSSKLLDIVKQVKNLSNIKLYGIGANLTCYGGIEPTVNNTDELYNVVKDIEEKCGINFEVITGANSTSYKLLSNGILKNKMNYVRFGESIFLGLIPGYYEKINNLHQNNFIVEAEIVELEEKDSVPRGNILKNAFGEIPHFEDKGLRLKALINIGKQDTSLNLKPLDKDITILDGSSDYLVLDLTDSKTKYKVGDIVRFIPDYEALLKLMTSPYVKKEVK
jgi:predicted amino acid racemase